MADTSNGAPAGYPRRGDIDADTETNFELWASDLRRWAQVFEDAARDDYYDIHGSNYDAWNADERSRKAAVHQALKEMEPWWDCLWN